MSRVADVYRNVIRCDGRCGTEVNLNVLRENQGRGYPPYDLMSLGWCFNGLGDYCRACWDLRVKGLLPWK